MEGKAKRTCAFCGTAGALSKEHVMPRWIWREAHGEDPSGPTIQNPAPAKYRETMHPSIHGLDREFAPRGTQPLMRATAVTVRAVCAGCNNGWMARLEEQVKPILVRMNRDRTWGLSREEAAVLRRWVIKTALMLEQSDAETAFASRAVFECVARNEPPPGTWYIGLGRAHPDVQFRLMSSPAAREQHVLHDVTGLPVSTEHEIFAVQHIIVPWNLFFIVRYTPHPVIAPARLDHELVRDTRRRPVSLDNLATGRRYRLKDLAVFTKADLDLLMFWTHSSGGRTGLHLGPGQDGRPAVLDQAGFLNNMGAEWEVVRTERMPIDPSEW